MGAVCAEQMSKWWKNDSAIDAHYAKDYYGNGRDYFDEVTEDDILSEEYCMICGTPKMEWETVKHDKYCPDCYDAVVDGLWDIKKNINHGVCEVAELWDAIDDLWDSAFPRGGKDD